MRGRRVSEACLGMGSQTPERERRGGELTVLNELKVCYQIVFHEKR